VADWLNGNKIIFFHSLGKLGTFGLSSKPTASELFCVFRFHSSFSMLSDEELAFLLAEDEKMERSMEIERVIDPILRQHCAKQQQKLDRQNVESETEINELLIPVGVRAMSFVMSDCKPLNYAVRLIVNDSLSMDETLMKALEKTIWKQLSHSCHKVQRNQSVSLLRRHSHMHCHVWNFSEQLLR
jgi:hypothetical protein